jgi:hypothetical protein
MPKYIIAWTERYERIVERKDLDEAAQHARFAVAQKPGAVLLSVEEVKDEPQSTK